MLRVFVGLAGVLPFLAGDLAGVPDLGYERCNTWGDLSTKSAAWVYDFSSLSLTHSLLFLYSSGWALLVLAEDWQSSTTEDDLRLCVCTMVKTR